MMASALAALARSLPIVGLLSVGLALSAPDSSPALAHEQTELVAVSGTGKCPSSVENCSQTWTHINSWTHYTASVSPGCTVEVIEQCGITVISRSATSSCRNSSNCGHGPHSSTPAPPALERGPNGMDIATPTTGGQDSGGLPSTTSMTHQARRQTRLRLPCRQTRLPRNRTRPCSIHPTSTGPTSTRAPTAGACRRV